MSPEHSFQIHREINDGEGIEEEFWCWIDRDGLDERVPLLPVPRTVSNFISPSLHTGQEEEEEDSIPPVSLSTTLSLSLSLSAFFSSREISGSLTLENESFPGKYFFSPLLPFSFFSLTPLQVILSKRSRDTERRRDFLIGTKAALTRGLVISRDTHGHGYQGHAPFEVETRLN